MYRNDGNNCLPPMSSSSVDMLSPEYMLNLSPPFPADMRAAFHAFQAPPFQMLSFSAARSHLSMENSQRPQRILPNTPNCGNNELPRQLMLMGPPSDPSEGYPKGRRPGRELVRRPLDEHPYMPLAGRKRSRPGEHEEYRTKEETKELLIHKKAVVERETGSRIRSYVWEYMGPIRNIDTGKIVHNMIGCRYCSEVFYPYPDKSRGTSILRPHGCKQVGPIKLRHERMEKEREEGRHRQKQCLEFLSQENAASGASSPVSDLQISAWNLKQIEGEGRNQQRELTPEGDDRKSVMPNPPPLKEHIMNSPSPQSAHAVSLHQGTPVSGGMVGGGLVNNVGGRSSSSVGGCASPPPSSTKDGPPQLLCVRWGNFDSNIVSMFSKLRNNETFVDVTIWCEGKQLKCHKMILSACSVYFEKMLTEVSNPHPVIVLSNMRFWEIQALVEFMYRGEVSVHQEKLQSLLRAAESLQIKGLGSPSNEMGIPGGLDGQNPLDEEISNSTMDMTTNSIHNNSNSHLQNHINNSMKDDNGPNSNSSSNSHSLHTSHHLGAAANNNNSNNNHQAPWQKFGLSGTSNMMGIDLSNHSGSGALSLSSLHGANLPLPLSLSAGSPQSVSGSQGSGCGPASKRRKKETPRRIDLPRTAGMPLPAFNSTMGSEIEEDDDAASEDSMAAHERNHVDGLKMDMQHDQSYGDEEECDGQENYEEHDPGAQGEDDISSEHGDDMDEEQDGALSLRVSNLSDSERMDRERSRKGNPMKKILGIGNNNNNNEGGTQNLIHNVSSGGD